MPTQDFVAPGIGGAADNVVSLPIRDGGVNASAIGGSFPSKASLVAGKASLFRPVVGGDINIVIQGLRVAIQHWDTYEAMIPGYMWTVLNRSGQLITAEARRALNGETIFERAYDTGDTFRSVHHKMTPPGDSVSVSVGPTTFYAPMIEYGLGPHSSYGPRPFMSYALTEVLPFMVQAFADLQSVAKFGARAKISSGPYRTTLEAFIHRWRGTLYTREKALGDIAPFGVSGIEIPGTGATRGALLGMARILGDMQAVLGRTVGLRFQRRLTGKVTGRLIGVGSRTVFINKVVGAKIGLGERIYNRQAGKAITKYVDQNKALNRFTGSR